MYNGIINVYKEAGYTSHDVVARLRGILRQKKIGHTGTLDPDAEGVLPVCLGSATRLCDMLADKSKEYKAVMLLGVMTDTEDMSGKILKKHDVDVDEPGLLKIISSFTGDYDQIPPMYSALKVGGKKLYEFARAGKEIERKPRHVFIDAIEDIEIKLPRVSFTVKCSKGTYIRSLCRDIGEKAGCGGCMEKLLRTRVGRFELSDSVKLTDIAEYEASGTLSEHIMAVDSFFSEYDEIVVSGREEILVRNGNRFSSEKFTEDGAKARVYMENEGMKKFAGIYEYDKAAGLMKPVKMFLSGD